MNSRRKFAALAAQCGSAALLASVVLAGMSAPSVAFAGEGGFNDRDNILIADQYNNRVIEIERDTHKIVWHFGNGSELPGPKSVVGTNDAERVGTFTLISGTGIPSSDPNNPLPGCSTPATGCPDNRVFIVNRHGKIVWQYGQDGGAAGSDFDQLNTPVHALFLSEFPKHPGFHVMITDQANERIIVVNVRHQIVWQYGMTGVTGNGPDQLNNPNSAELLDNGHILIADENNNRVIEVTIDKNVVATFTDAGGALPISGAAFASRLSNGNTLITDSNNSRIVEVDANDATVWEYFTNTDAASNPAPLPTRAVRLKNGHTLISDQYNNRVIEVTRDKKIVFQQGQLNVLGSGFDLLNGPYDAKAIGDYTGLTPPFDWDSSELPASLR